MVTLLVRWIVITCTIMTRYFFVTGESDKKYS